MIQKLTILFLLAIFLGNRQLLSAHHEFLTSDTMLILSIPKCGTHLLGKLLSVLTGDKHQQDGFAQSSNFYATVEEVVQLHRQHMFTHVHYAYETAIIVNTCKKWDISLFFIYRDPRDQIISYIHSTYDADKAATDEHYMDDRINDAIDPTKDYIWGYYGINDLYVKNMPWANDPYVCAVRFEDLVGARGNGSFDVQYETIARVANHLGMSLSLPEIFFAAKKIFGNTSTFKSGKIGTWKKYFTQGNKDFFKQHAGQLLIDLGYETDFNW
jgi:hypothetical protein